MSPRHVIAPSIFFTLAAAIAACSSGTVNTNVDAGESDASVTDSGGKADSGFLTAGDSGVDSGADQDSSLPSVRRPFLVGGSMRSSTVTNRADWSRKMALPAIVKHEGTAARLAATWRADGLEEHASIAAFARFTLHLLALGAPPDLVRDSQRASLDEVRHARVCFALAEHYSRSSTSTASRASSVAQGPAPLSLEGALGILSLAEAAALCAEEGCVGETLGAVLAKEQLAVANDPSLVVALRKIAADEERHAELAWRFVAWAVERGGKEVLDAVTARVRDACARTLEMQIKRYDDVDLETWHAHGRLTCEESRAVASRAIADVIMPCLDLLRVRTGIDRASIAAPRIA